MSRKVENLNLKLLSSFLLGLLGFDLAVYGMATEQIGPDRDHPTVAQPDWPKKIVTLPRHPTRVYSVWVNGREDFYFKADLSRVNELLALFSEARLRDHEVWIRTGKPVVQSFKKDVIDYNVHLEILAGIALAMGGGDDRPEPRLTIYVDDAVPAGLLTLPDNLIVHSDIPEVARNSTITKPARQTWCGKVQFEGNDAAKGMQPGIRTQISLWEAPYDDEIKLATVDREGRFAASFSAVEMAQLKSGQSWLTITVGNWLTEAKKSDPIFPVDKLGDQNTAKAVTVSAPQFYYGRILFEDGRPPKLEPPPWPGARITLSFPYAGMVEPDEEGYFKVFFTQEQYDKAAADKPQKNIYIPNPSEHGSATARVAFPVELLSRDKARAGIVRVPRP